jgi:hypothetical protein
MAEADLLTLGADLVQAADDAGITARLLGGVAVALHSASAAAPPFARAYEDIDLMIEKKGRKKIDDVSRACGFAPDQEFNNLHGLERRAYYSDAGKLDVFVGEFSMCHSLSFDGRLEIESPTIPLSDLFLTKAQIYELNRKDAYDLLAVLADHTVGEEEAGMIGAGRIREVCGNDWGFWRTVSRTLETLEEIANTDDALERARPAIVSAIGDLRQTLTAAPKSAKWKMRAKIGERMVWYALPEDPDRHPELA